MISGLLIQTVHKPPFLSLPGAESEFLVDMLCVHGLRIVGCVYQAVQCGRRCWSGSGACLLCMCSVSCSLDTGLQQCAVYRVQSAYILAVSRYGDNGLQQRSVYVTPGRLEVWRRHRLKLASMHAQRE